VSGVVAGLVGSVKAAPANLFPDPSFESGTLNAGWSGLFQNTSVTPRTGTRSLQVYYTFDYDTGDFASGGSFSSTLLTVGLKYSFSIWVKRVAGTISVATFGETKTVTQFSPIDGYNQLKWENVTAASTTFSVAIDTANLTTFYVDDLALVQGATAL